MDLLHVVVLKKRYSFQLWSNFFFLHKRSFMLVVNARVWYFPFDLQYKKCFKLFWNNFPLNYDEEWYWYEKLIVHIWIILARSECIYWNIGCVHVVEALMELCYCHVYGIEVLSPLFHHWLWIMFEFYENVWSEKSSSGCCSSGFWSTLESYQWHTYMCEYTQSIWS